MYKLIKNPITEQVDVVEKQEGSHRLCIPLNVPDNTDYQEYLKWVEEGNTPEPAEGTE